MAPSTRRPRRPEQQLQRDALSAVYKLVPQPFMVWHTPNGGMRRKTEAAIFAGLGVKAGIPDLLILRLGKLYAIELKAGKGSLTDKQFDTLWEMRTCGAEVAVCWTLAEVENVLMAWGISRASLRGGEKAA